MKKATILIYLLSLLMVQFLYADEGMYLIDQIPNLNLEEKGLQIPPDSLWNHTNGGVSSAVISLGGCTASFVSPNGLIVTNHHCAYGAIQRNSTEENNLLENGFLAASYEEELPTFGTNVYILKNFKDVTKEVLEGTEETDSAKERHDQIEKNIKRIVKEAEEDTTISARVASMNSGMWYVKYIFTRIQDVRLVYAPPQSIGKFGGDIDNFEWPRHTGDYAFLRAYVGPDGEPAEPSEKNVPYQPKKWLTVSDDGYTENEFVMVLGFPGGTARYRTSFDIDYRQSFYYPWRIDMLKKYINLLEKRSKEDTKVGIKLASRLSGLNNSLKNSLGQYDGLRRTNLLQQKKRFEKSFISYLEKTPEAKSKYGHILPEIEKQYRELMAYEQKRYFGYWLRIASSVLGSAQRAVTWFEEKEKPELERKPGYGDKDMQRSLKRLKYSFRNYDDETEMRALALFFSLAHELPEDQRIEAIEAIAPGQSGAEKRKAEQAFIENLYKNSVLTSLEGREKIFDLSVKPEAFENDPAIVFAQALKKELDPLDEKDKEFDGSITTLRPQYIRALAEWQNTNMYPDANGTIRLTYGYVKGYSPRDAVEYDYFTSTDGILQKYSGEDPFDAPEKLLGLIRTADFAPYREAKTDKMHVNFLTTLDTTGGNSGSPVLNKRGELIGLLFDGNYESIVADYIFDEPMTRSICVDIRYVLWLMKKVDGAENLLKEMTLSSSVQ